MFILWIFYATFYILYLMYILLKICGSVRTHVQFAYYDNFIVSQSSALLWIELIAATHLILPASTFQLLICTIMEKQSKPQRQMWNEARYYYLFLFIINRNSARIQLWENEYCFAHALNYWFRIRGQLFRIREWQVQLQCNVKNTAGLLIILLITSFQFGCIFHFFLQI